MCTLNQFYSSSQYWYVPCILFIEINHALRYYTCLINEKLFQIIIELWYSSIQTVSKNKLFYDQSNLSVPPNTAHNWNEVRLYLIHADFACQEFGLYFSSKIVLSAIPYANKTFYHWMVHVHICNVVILVSNNHSNYINTHLSSITTLNHFYTN